MKYELINSNAKADNLVSLVFENRNIPEEKIFDFINCDKDFRTNPLDYVNMDKAVKLLSEHIKRNSKITILVDCDCDGHMSSVIIYKTIKTIDPKAKVKFVLHEGKKHGLYNEVINQIKNLETNLLIVPDAGSNQIEEILEIMNSSIDVIVIDHHDAIYNEDTIIVNNQYNDINKCLSGGAMALKLSEALIKEEADKYRDLAAVSILSDNMPMNNLENNYYVKNGLKNINNEFIKKAVKDYTKASREDVAFTISPIVNSIIRMGDKQDKIILMSALLGLDGKVELPVRKNSKKNEEYNYMDAAIKISKWRRDEQKEAVEKELENVELEHDIPVNIIKLSEDFNINITGYFANVVSGKNLKPTLALKYDIDNDSYRGSVRSAGVENFKDFLWNSGLFENCEGHQGAFGVEIKRDKLDDFLDFIKNTSLPSDKVYKVDKIYDYYELQHNDIETIDSLKEVWGRDMEAPLFAIKIKDAAVSFIGAKGNTLRIIKGGITYIKFNCSDEEVEYLKHLSGTIDIEIVGTLEVNVFNGRHNHQVKILDYKVLSEGIQYNVFEDDIFEDLF